MIPVSLTLKGLYSYQQEQTIYFDKLVAAQLFGIFGAVGSGKSTILEAISFALYGDTERLNRSDSRNYNMMNLKSDLLLIDYVFQNFDQVTYRFVVQGRRNKKDFEDVRTFSRSAYRREGNNWIPLEVGNAEAVIGLNYENFRRTIIIPQGKFQEFLQLTDKARTEMLKEIFQLSKYEFFGQTVSLERKNAAQIQHIKGRLVAYEEVNETIIAEAAAKAKALEKAFASLKEVVADSEEKLREQMRLQQLFQELKHAEELQHTLSEQEDGYKQLEGKLNDYEYCERHFKHELLKQADVSGNMLKKENMLVENKQQLKVCETKLMQLQQDFAKIQQHFSQLDAVKQKMREYGQLILIKDIQHGINQLEGRLAKGKTFIQNAASEKEASSKHIERIKTLLLKMKAELPEGSLLGDIRTWFVQQESLKQQVLSNKRRYQELVGKKDERLTYRKTMLVDRSIDESIEPTEFANQAIKDMEKRVKLVEEEIAHDRIQLKLVEFATGLVSGEACPLCGSLDHPQPMQVKNVQEDLEQKTATRRKLLDDMKDWQDFLGQYAILNSEIRSAETALNEAQAYLHQDQKKLSDHLKTFIWEAYDPADSPSFYRMLSNIKTQEEEIKNLEASLIAHELSYKQAQQEQERYDHAIHELNNQFNQKQGSLESLMSQITMLDKDTVHDTKKEFILQTIAELTAYVQQTERLFKETQEVLEHEQREKLVLEERQDSLMHYLDSEGERLNSITRHLSAILADSPYESLDRVSIILGQDLDVSEIRQNIQTFKQKRYSAAEKVRFLQVQCSGKVFDITSFAVLQKAVLQRRERLEHIQNEHLLAKNELGRLTVQLNEKHVLHQQLTQTEKRAENLAVLRNMFKGNGFVSYISTVYLQQLCDAANKRFYKLTKQQLQLEITEKNDFQVRDFLNDGKLRLAKTLSGGQTFQASLSLALALAESVQQQQQAEQHFFFLDEGFGSLDKESLSIAFDTLKSLKKENRVVGIISHVEELQQEIDVFLRIKNDSFSGSDIKNSWEN